jgi:copper chaperone CopZ
MATTVITITGMTCGHCTSAVEEGLGQLPGVESVVADLASGQVSIEQDGSVSTDTLNAVVEEMGFGLA